MSRLGLAVLVAGLVVHVGLGLLVRDGPIPGLDTSALDAFEPLRSAAGVDVVGVLTDVGALPAACLAVVLGGLAATRRGRAGDALALVLGLLALFVLVQVTKAFWGRPRPEGMLTAARGLSYPSGHAAYATTWVAAAVVAGRRALVWVAAAVVLAVMASRLYLHVHFLTDVLGGAALGAAVYAAVLRK